MATFLTAFGSTHAALSFEANFGNGARLVPVPPTVRAGCGMGLLFSAFNAAEAHQRVEALAEELGVASQVEGIYEKSGSSYELA